MPSGVIVRSTSSARKEPRESVEWETAWQRPEARAAGALAVLIVVSSPFLGGSTEPWSQGVIIALFGLGLLIAPPRFAPHRFAWPASLAAVLLAATAFFPCSIGGGWKAREILANDLQIPLGLTLTPQPWLSLDALVLLIAGIAWWWWIATSLETAPLSRANLARWGAAGITGLAALSLAVKQGWVTIPFWPGFAPLGPFPNKNQMGNLLGAWAIVAGAAAVDSLRARRAAGFLWLAGVGILLAALLEAESRGGVLVLVGGVLCWGLWEGIRARRYREMGIALAAALCAMGAFFAFGGESFRKLVRLVTSLRDGMGATDFRIPIFRDAMNLIADAPWAGIGLGNFEAVFSLYRDASAVPARALHPESDWLWMAAELGWVALPICALLLAPAFVSSDRSRKGDPVLRAAAVAGFMFLLHGLVDVAGHRLGSALPGLFLLGLSVARGSQRRDSRIAAILFRCISVMLISCGAIWLLGSTTGVAVPGRIGAATKTREARESIAQENFAHAERAASNGLRWAPLDWELHFLRGIARVYQGNHIAAQQDFRRARALESTSADIAIREGEFWAYFDAPRAEESWAEALRRSGENRATVYRGMTWHGAELPGVLPILKRLAAGSSQLQLWYLEALAPPILEIELPARLETSMAAELSEGEQRVFFRLWKKVRDIDSLEHWLETHPSFLTTVWPAIAESAAESGDTRKAVQLALEHLPPPALPKLDPQPLETARREFHRDPANIAAGYRTFQAERDAGLHREALTTLQKLSEPPNAPGYLAYLKATLLAEIGDWNGAWMEIQRYQR